MMESNFFTGVHCALAVAPQMLARRSGTIVNIASIGGKVALPHLLPYTASKFAVVGFSEGLHAELRAKGRACADGVSGADADGFACERAFFRRQGAGVSLVQPGGESAGGFHERGVRGAADRAGGAVPGDGDCDHAAGGRRLAAGASGAGNCGASHEHGESSAAGRFRRKGRTAAGCGDARAGLSAGPHDGDSGGSPLQPELREVSGLGAHMAEELAADGVEPGVAAERGEVRVGDRAEDQIVMILKGGPQITDGFFLIAEQGPGAGESYPDDLPWLKIALLHGAHGFQHAVDTAAGEAILGGCGDVSELRVVGDGSDQAGLVDEGAVVLLREGQAGQIARRGDEVRLGALDLAQGGR